MLRVAGSLITNQVRAYDLLRMFGREGHPTPLGAATSRTRTSPSSPRSRTGTSTSWAATCSTSPPAVPARACGPSVTRTRPRTETKWSDPALGRRYGGGH
ncbi:hypothetical protein [Streptomyces sp. NPDC057301]|uniref:hypothetical protein n=1 Tax=Streptomyces sp. NPDC057301 TaxID=3346093 RepID=UPI0036410DE5